MELTPQQNKIFEQIKAFINSDASVFILRGYAGTGKTTMVKVIADYIAQSRFLALMAPTGRAARILRQKTGHNATTIHKAIYKKPRFDAKKVKDIAESEFKLIQDIFVPESGGSIVAIVDEASMVCSRKIEHELFAFGTDNIMEDLLTFVRPHYGGKVIFVGDPAQLPPIGEPHSNALRTEYFEEKGLKVVEAELTEVLRQQGDSTILKNAMMIRDLLKKEKRNNLVFEERKDDVETISPEDFLDWSAEQILENITADFETRSQADFKPIAAKILQYNKCPAVAPIGVLNEENQERLNLKLADIQKNLDLLRKNPHFAENIRSAFEKRDEISKERHENISLSPEARLFEGFLSRSDEIKAEAVRNSTARELADFHPDFNDERLNGLLLHYKARSFPKSLSSQEKELWEEYRAENLKKMLPKFMKEFQEAATRENLSTQEQFILEDIKLWLENVLPDSES